MGHLTGLSQHDFLGMAIKHQRILKALLVVYATDGYPGLA
jgi:hypothetical protein